jgi:long-chain acyl-CoA synthetase
MHVLKSILRQLIRHPLREFIIDDQRTWKGFHLYLGAQHLARAIEQTTNAEKIGLMLPTSGLYPMAVLATWLLGRSVVPLNYLLKHDDLEYVINDAGLDTIVTVGKMVEMFGPLPQSVTQMRLDEMQFKGLPRLRRAPHRPDDFLAVLMYTSGTSGRPKGVMLTAGNLAANCRQCVQWAGFNARDIMLGVLPQFHSFGLTVLTILPLTVGCRVVYTARFMPKKMIELLKEHRPTALIAIPTMFNALLNSKSADADAFSSMRFIVSGSEPLPAAVFNGFREKFNVTINEGYGLTETAPVTNWCRPQDHRPKSVGMALPDVRIKIVDAQGNALDTDQEGEICITGPNIMAGYYNLPDETAAVFDDEGYFRTGDMGRVDADGHLYITGRIKEMLIIGGENVFPREIEEVIIQHPSVHACAVIGVPDDSRGEVPLAFVEINEDHEFSETDLRSFTRERLAQYKVPREIRHVEALPRNPTGKILRRELNDQTPGIAG